MREQREQANGFVLAGGQSSRMGLDKGSIRFGDRPLVQIAAELLAGICSTVSLLAPPGRYPFLNLTHIPDRLPNLGPLAALASALEQTDTDLNLFLPCDMPFLTQGVMLDLLSGAKGVDAAVPRDSQGRWFPLSAAYRRSCIPAIENSLSKGLTRVSGIFCEVVVRPVQIELGSDSSFVNINSPEDLAAALQR